VTPPPADAAGAAPPAARSLRETARAAVAGVVPPLRLQSWQHWLIFAAVLLFLYEARGVIGPFVIAGMIAYIFTGGITFVQERLGWPRVLVAALHYLLVLAALGGVIYFGAHTLVRQVVELNHQGPNLVESGLRQFLGNGAIDVLGQPYDAHTLAQRLDEAIREAQSHPGDALHVGELIVSRLLDALLVVFVSFYLIVDGHKLGAYLLKFVPADSRPVAGLMAGRIHTVLGAYLRGQLLLIIIMSTVTWVALHFLFNLRYALPIALASGVLEIMPLLGPIIAATIAAAVALAQPGGGPGLAVGILILYFILRQAEDQLVIPFVVGRAVELHPIATIFAVLAGGAVAGILGVLLAVPVAAAIKIILDYLYPATPAHAIAQARPGLDQAARERDGDAEASGEQRVAREKE
jgi:predicted PurR-regulated permease PerM